MVVKTSTITKSGRSKESLIYLCLQHTHTNTHILRPSGLSRITKVSRYQKQSGFYWSNRRWVAVSSAGTYANLHLNPDR